MKQIQQLIRVCPHCYEATGDTFEFDAAPPVGTTCDDCGSRLQPHQPEPEGPEGWLHDREYSDRYEDLQEDHRDARGGMMG